MVLVDILVTYPFSERGVCNKVISELNPNEQSELNHIGWYGLDFAGRPCTQKEFLWDLQMNYILPTIKEVESLETLIANYIRFDYSLPRRATILFLREDKDSLLYHQAVQVLNHWILRNPIS